MPLQQNISHNSISNQVVITHLLKKFNYPAEMTIIKPDSSTDTGIYVWNMHSEYTDYTIWQRHY